MSLRKPTGLQTSWCVGFSAVSLALHARSSARCPLFPDSSTICVVFAEEYDAFAS
jgi:hypothetical protein